LFIVNPFVPEPFEPGTINPATFAVVTLAPEFIISVMPLFPFPPPLITAVLINTIVPPLLMVTNPALAMVRLLLPLLTFNEPLNVKLFALAATSTVTVTPALIVTSSEELGTDEPPQVVVLLQLPLTVAVLWDKASALIIICNIDRTKNLQNVEAVKKINGFSVLV
jgi:hypothetical protein